MSKPDRLAYPRPAPERTKRELRPTRYEQAVVAIACLLMAFVVQIALVLPYLLAVAIPGK